MAVRKLRVFFVLLVVSMASACTTMRAPSDTDPLEGFNRSIDSFNEAVDQGVGKPLARGYNNYVAPEFRTCIANFFANLDDLGIAVNNLLQGKPKDALSDLCRVAINSTVGLLGLVDVASDFGFEKHDEDFGQTLGVWGVGPGPYVVLPFFGPSNLRDAFGRVVDGTVDPLGNHRPVDERNVARFIDVVDTRARLLPATDLVDRVALDKYSFVRNAYLARRASQIRDGRPEEEQEEEVTSDKSSMLNMPEGMVISGKALASLGLD